MVTNLLSWIFFGLVIGVIVHRLDQKGTRRNLLMTVIVGIVGAVLGGILANFIFNIKVSLFSLHGVLFVTAFSLLLILLQRAISRNG